MSLSSRKKNKITVKKVLRKASLKVRRSVSKSKKTKLKKVSKVSRRPPRVIPVPSFTIPSREESRLPAKPAHHDDRIPMHYHEDRLVLLVRDPWWLYAYWEVTPNRQNEVIESMRRDHQDGWKMVLRVYDVTAASIEAPRSFFDIELNFFADNWYVDVGIPDRSWIAELGYRTADDRFYCLVRSNLVRTPSFGVSDILDEEWMLPEDVYYRIIGYSSIGSQQGSMDIRRLIEKYMRGAVSSERPPAPTLKK